MKRYAQQYVGKYIDGKWILTLYTFDTLRSTSAYISKSYVNSWYKREHLDNYCKDLFDTLQFEYGAEDEINLAKSEKLTVVSHYYD